MQSTGQPIEFLLQSVEDMLETGKSESAILEQLAAEGFDQEQVKAVIKQLKDLRYLKRRKRGFKLGVAGSIILVIGFALTVLLFHSGSSFNLVMYGMTSIGVILLLVGMIDIMGW